MTSRQRCSSAFATAIFVRKLRFPKTEVAAPTQGPIPTVHGSFLLPVFFYALCNFNFLNEDSRFFSFINVMDRKGDFLSPSFCGSRRSPSSERDVSPGSVHQDDAFSKEQINEIEQLLARLGESNTSDSFISDGENNAPATTVAPAPIEMAHSTTPVRSAKVRAGPAASDKDRVWRAHIKDVHTYMEAKRSTTTRAILHERQHRKNVHLSRPWQRASQGDQIPVTAPSAEVSAVEYIVQPTDMKNFVASRS